MGVKCVGFAFGAFVWSVRVCVQTANCKVEVFCCKMEVRTVVVSLSKTVVSCSSVRPKTSSSLISVACKDAAIRRVSLCLFKRNTYVVSQKGRPMIT